MTPIFIKSDRHLIDVSKVTHAELVRKDRRVKFHFAGGGAVLLAYAEADCVLRVMGELSRGANAPLMACIVGGGK